MATKSYKLRIDLRVWQDPPIDTSRFKTRREEVEQTRQWLDDTLVAFNKGVDYLSLWLLRMNRGAGVFRKRLDHVWGEWESIKTHAELLSARQSRQSEPADFALIENRDLLTVFTTRGKSEPEAVELAGCCHRIAAAICPPSEERDGTQMPRDDLDLLTLNNSTAKGIRERGLSKSGELKQLSGRKPQWALKEAVCQIAESATSWEVFSEALPATPQFKSAARDGQKLFKRLDEKYRNLEWNRAQSALHDYAKLWEREKAEAEAKTTKSAESGAIAAYRRLLDADCLPLPGFLRPNGMLSLTGALAEWNYSMWNMSGQRVRSHFGWVRRRADERLLWERSKLLFENGGWIRISRDGKKLRENDLRAEDFRLLQPNDTESLDFEQHQGFRNCAWFLEFRHYEDNEMPKHLESTAFAASGQSMIRKRTAKGWVKIRDKWRNMIQKSSPSAEDLLEAVNALRNRKPREYGDQRLFEWLVHPSRRWLWDGSDRGRDNNCGRDDRDCVAAFVSYNEKYAEKPDSVTFTRSDPVKHPVWPFFGENSAVEYALRREVGSDGTNRLVLVLSQLLMTKDDGTYSAIKNVQVGLRGYDDFERSFEFPDGRSQVTPKERLTFKDDLLGGNTRAGSLGGLKLVWEREALETEKRGAAPLSRRSRIFANFSCDAGEGASPEWLTKGVGYLDKRNLRNGVKGLFALDPGILRSSRNNRNSPVLSPGNRRWPIEAIKNELRVRGTDLGFRCSSAGVCWRVTFEKPKDKVCWDIGECENKRVFAVWERSGHVSLPGDNEELPKEEQSLRDRLYTLRTRLNLNNALLRIVRLLTLAEVTRRVPCGKKFRRRSDGRDMPAGIKWQIVSSHLSDNEIRDNCRKAAEQLMRWAETDAMRGSLTAIGYAGSFWDWLNKQDQTLTSLTTCVPSIAVPSEKDARSGSVNRDELAHKRAEQENAFAASVYMNRVTLARSLCDGQDVNNRRRAIAGLWAKLDDALLREISYGEQDGNGLLRILRKPPVTKHKDRKDDANNLPHGRTHRGGLSMARLNFLDDVKNFVRRWSCRPRWPGDIRRIAEDAKFDRQDTEHLDHIREHRAKLIAHADVAQALGFEQDLRRGLWRFPEPASDDPLWHRPERGHFYRVQDGRLTQCVVPGGFSNLDVTHPQRAYAPVHVLVYEDLSRYSFRSDRPRNENAGLARWSHRRILSFAKHIGGLFGMPVATTFAGYSSRFCSCCGTPGCRASRFNPAWLGQQWMQSILESNDIRDAAMKSVAREVREKLMKQPGVYDQEENRPWVLRDGGTHFVCASGQCTNHIKPINADENAAANIGLRFLRGTEDFKVWINGQGKPSRGLKYTTVTRFTLAENFGNSDEPFWIVSSDATPQKGRGKKVVSDSEDIAEIEDEGESGGHQLFRDPSGSVSAADRWFEGKVFWANVARKAAYGVKAANASRFGSGEEEN